MRLEKQLGDAGRAHRLICQIGLSGSYVFELHLVVLAWGDECVPVFVYMLPE